LCVMAVMDCWRTSSRPLFCRHWRPSGKARNYLRPSAVSGCANVINFKYFRWKKWRVFPPCTYKAYWSLPLRKISRMAEILVGVSHGFCECMYVRYILNSNVA
jgi:hypothetical protein